MQEFDNAGILKCYIVIFQDINVQLPKLLAKGWFLCNIAVVRVVTDCTASFLTLPHISLHTVVSSPLFLTTTGIVLMVGCILMSESGLWSDSERRRKLEETQQLRNPLAHVAPADNRTPRNSSNYPRTRAMMYPTKCSHSDNCLKREILSTDAAAVAREGHPEHQSKHLTHG